MQEELLFSNGIDSKRKHELLIIKIDTNPAFLHELKILGLLKLSSSKKEVLWFNMSSEKQ